MTALQTETSGSLKRTLKPSWVFAMAVGSAVGWGAFILPFDWIATGGLVGSLIGFLIGGAMIAVIGLSYGAVIKALPVTGGGMAFALASLGRRHGFIAGWSLTVGYAGIVALNASAVTLVFRVTMPDLVMQGKLYSVAGWTIHLPEVIIASLFLITFALINIRGVEFSGRFQFVAVVVMLVGIVLLLVAGLTHLSISRPTLPPAFAAGTTAIAGVLAIVAIAPWAYIGFDSVPQLAGEFNFSARKALGLLLWGIAAATLIYLAMIVTTAITVSDNRETYVDDAWPPAASMTDVFGPLGLILMVIAVSMGVLTGLNGFFASASRVIFTMGRASMLPKAFARLHPQYGTPIAGIVTTMLLCLITPWFGRAALSWIVDMTSAGITIAYFYTCYCAYKIGRKGHVFGMSEHYKPNKAMQVYGFIGCVLALIFLALLLIPRSPGALGRESLIALIIWCVAGIIFYFIRRKEFTRRSDQAILRTVFQSQNH